MPLQELRNVRFERDEVRGILGVAPDGNRARDVSVQQTQRTAEEIDPRGDDRRPDAVVVEHERLDQVIEMTLVIGDVDRATGMGRGASNPDALFDPLDLAQDGVERMLEGPIDGVPLCSPKLVEVAVNPLPRLELGLPMTSPQVSRDILPREHRLGDVVEHQGSTISELPGVPAGS